MNLFYHPHAPEAKPDLSQLPGARKDQPQFYMADEGLAHAVDTALLLGRPLLVTGEPGTGKTQLAASIAYQLHLGEPRGTPLGFVAKSTSQAGDLFYTFDALGRLKSSADDARSRSSDTRAFLRYNALGLAILYANPPERVAQLLPADRLHDAQRHSVVLIDEIDKAPRDFPNDLLHELEHMSFRIPELDGVEVTAAADFRPIVVITSNSERGLPDAFLRRCIYYDIPFPDRASLDRILRARMADWYEESFAADALSLFELLRDEALRLSKRPSTAELIGWMTALVRAEAERAQRVRGVPPKNPLVDRSIALHTLGALLKSRDDMRSARPQVERWINKRA